MQNIIELVDQLGKIDALIKENEAIARKLKAELIAQGVGKYEGAAFYAEVQHYDRTTIDPKKVRALLSEDTINQISQTKAIDAVVVKSMGV